MKGLSNTGVALIVVAILAVVAIFGSALYLAASTPRVVTPTAYKGEIYCEGLDTADFPTVGTASGENITLTNFTDTSQEKTGYFLVRIKHGAIQALDVKIEKYAGATLPDYVKISSARLLDEDGNELAAFVKDKSGMKLNYNSPLDDDVIIEVNLASYDVPSASIDTARQWTVDLDATTEGDDDSATCYILGGYAVSAA